MLSINNTALFQAITRGNVEEIKSLLADEDETDDYVNTTNEAGSTALMYLASQDLPEAAYTAIAQLLLDHGARVNIRHPSTGKTALHAAAAYGRPQLCKLLIDAGANLETRYTNGGTPLILAASFPDTADALQTLLDAGADVNATTRLKDDPARQGGKTALMFAIEEGLIENIKVLFKHDADIRKLTTYHHSILSYIPLQKVELLDDLGLSTESYIADLSSVSAEVNSLVAEYENKKFRLLRQKQRDQQLIEARETVTAELADLEEHLSEAKGKLERDDLHRSISSCRGKLSLLSFPAKEIAQHERALSQLEEKLQTTITELYATKYEYLFKAIEASLSPKSTEDSDDTIEELSAHIQKTKVA